MFHCGECESGACVFVRMRGGLICFRVESARGEGVVCVCLCVCEVG